MKFRIALNLLAMASMSCSLTPTPQHSVVSYRGLHTGPDSIWASGTKGTVKVSFDQGVTWADKSISLAADLDLRDIHSLGDGVAVAMSAGPGHKSRIFRTDDNAESWQEVARCNQPDGFWDGISFWDTQHGLLVGDPIDGALDLRKTDDGGKTWQALPDGSRPQVDEGEYCFAASGTSLCMGDSGRVWLATGGSRSRVFISEDWGQTWIGVDTPLHDGAPGSGIFSIHMRDSLNGIIVGGNYELPNESTKNAAKTSDGGKNWKLLTGAGIRGYRSCVEWRDGVWRTTGSNGSEVSWDDGASWHGYAAGRGFNAVSGRILAGDKGGLQLPQATTIPKKPNILFFLVDDLGWQDTSVSFAGTPHALNQRFATPAIQALANSGARFSQAYAASPVCSPTRVSILSGENPISSGVSNWIPGEANNGPEQQRWALPNWNQNGLDSSSVTLPRTLQMSGYQTAHLGKAHFGAKNTEGADPLKLGFEVNVGGSHIGHPGNYFPPYGKNGSSHQVPGLDDLRKSDLYLSDALTSKASAILDSFASNSNSAPFFMHFSHYAVHTPIQPNYKSMVESVDRSLATINGQLAQLGIADNTIVIFFSDNGGLVTHGGPPTSCAPLAGGKGTTKEGGTRVPLIIKWPGKTTANQQIDTPVISDDFMPTLLQAAGIGDYQRQWDGTSIVPLLEGRDIQPRDLIWHWPHYWAGTWLRNKFDFVTSFSALRRDDWKLVWLWDEQRAELFNLVEDVSESNDLSKHNPQLTRQLVNALSKRLRASNAPRPRHHLRDEAAPWPLMPQVLNEDGGWCWFQDERAIMAKDEVFFGSVATGWQDKSRKGDIDLTRWNPNTGAIEMQVLHHNLQADDHNAPALLSHENELLAVYAKHGSDKYMRVRKGPTNDFSNWPTENAIPISKTKVGVTYANLFRLNDRTFNFFRGLNWNPTLFSSDDYGETWNLEGRLLGGPGRPYLKYQGDNKVVHFVATDQHPRDFDNSLYHGFTDGRTIFSSDKSKIGVIGNSPPSPDEMTKIFAGSADAVAWPCDLALDPVTGHPISIFSVQVDGANMKRGSGGMDHRFYYASWNGAKWNVNEIAYAGSKLYSGEDDYIGLAAINPNDPKQIVISTDAHPQTGKALVSSADGQRHRELYVGYLQENQTWLWNALTMDSSQDQLRPIIPAGYPQSLLWLSGNMNTYTDYQFQVLGSLLSTN